jgi:hypothetical protein
MSLTAEQEAFLASIEAKGSRPDKASILGTPLFNVTMYPPMATARPPRSTLAARDQSSLFRLAEQI